jgi:hypothetical protein
MVAGAGAGADLLWEKNTAEFWLISLSEQGESL